MNIMNSDFSLESSSTCGEPHASGQTASRHGWTGRFIEGSAQQGFAAMRRAGNRLALRTVRMILPQSEEPTPTLPDLDNSEFLVLSLISDIGAAEPSAIADRFGLPETTVHQIVGRLIVLKLAVRRRYPIDPRIQWLVPTVAGEDMVRNARPAPYDPASSSHPTAA